ncbi:cell division protein PerM [Gordonia sp. NPDC003425]
MPSLRSASADNLAARLRQVRRHSRLQRANADGTARELILVAFGVPVITLGVLLVGLLAVLLLAGSALSGIAGALATCWLAVHQVPVTISGVTIGVLPLLPTLLIAAGTAVSAASVARRGRAATEVTAVACAAVGGPLLITAMSLAVVMDGSSDLQVQSPNALLAFGCTLAVHGVAAALGIGWARRRDLQSRLALTAADRRGVRYGVVAALALLAAGGAVVVIRLVMRWHLVGQLIAGGYDFDGFLGLTGLSVLYLPNAIVGAAAVLVGAHVHVGSASVALTGVHGGAVPPLPVLAVLPGGDVGTWGIVGFVVPAAIAAFVGWRCRSADPVAHARAVGVAAGVAATVMVVLGLSLGGALGEFGSAGVDVAAMGVFTFGWIAVVGLLVVLIYGYLPSTRSARRDGHGVVDLEPDLDDWFDDRGYDDDYVDDGPVVVDEGLAVHYEEDAYEDDEDDAYDEDEYSSDVGEDPAGPDEAHDDDRGDEHAADDGGDGQHDPAHHELKV